MTAVDLLTRAAAKVREVAEGARIIDVLIPWTISRDDATQVWDAKERLVASAEGAVEAEHIALWHPGNALLVADWLDKVAAVCREAEGTPLEIVANGLAEPALALARSILDEEA